MVSPLARREQLAFVRARGLSLRRACGLIGMSRATPSYELRLPAKDAPVLAAMKALSAQYPRYGYRRIRVLLRRSGLIHPRVPGHRCGRGHSVQTGDRGAVAPGEPARGAAVHPLGQWTGVCQPGHPGVDRARRHRHCAQRPGQAFAERHRRELQRQVPRRVPVHRVVSLAPRSRCPDRSLAQSLQRGTSPQQPAILDPGGVQTGTAQRTATRPSSRNNCLD